MQRIYLALGSNVGDRRSYMAAALSYIQDHARITRVSNIYQSPAMLPGNCPPEWDIEFLNMVVECETQLPPAQLLTHVKEVEKRLGRPQEYARWSPRNIDIDIITYGDDVLDDDTLTIPHPGLAERDFFLLPLAEIAPMWRYPGNAHEHSGKTAQELAEEYKTRRPVTAQISQRWKKIAI